MKKIGLIMIYFGEFPMYVKIFFRTLKECSNIDFLLFTDQRVIADEYINLKVYYTSLEELRERFQGYFDFPISLDKAYKICDYRPAFGEIFSLELKEYDYWGHCDMDMVLGNVMKFLPNNIFEYNSKIYQHGHLTLYKNTFEVNKIYREKGGQNFKDVFSTPIACIFDEVEGIQKKFDLLHINTYKKRDCVDISPWHYSFKRSETNLTKEERRGFNYEKQVFYWQNGGVYRAYWLKDKIHIDEFNYLHFQKRNLPVNFNNVDNVKAFYITRNGFYEKDISCNPTLKEIMKYNSNSKIKDLAFLFKYYYFIWKRRFNKYILRK